MLELIFQIYTSKFAVKVATGCVLLGILFSVVALILLSISEKWEQKKRLQT